MQVVALSAPSEPWEVITVTVPMGGGGDKYTRCPVIAWGLRSDGKVVPITPDHIYLHPGEHYVVMRLGDMTMTCWNEDGRAFANLNAWADWLATQSA